jgi:hypothetical protein
MDARTIEQYWREKSKVKTPLCDYITNNIYLPEKNKINAL